MATPTALAFAHNELKDIHDVVPRSASDDACLNELQEVLTRYGMEKRFGITLLHKHFDLAPDEIMVEHTDVARRTLISKPMKKDEVPSSNLAEVTWEMGQQGVVGACRSHCYYDSTLPRHDTRHTAEGISQQGN